MMDDNMIKDDDSVQPARLDLRSQDIAADRRQDPLRLYPEICTEGGQIDFDRLKLALIEAVDAGSPPQCLTGPPS